MNPKVQDVQLRTFERKTCMDHYLPRSKHQCPAWPNQSDPGGGCTSSLATNATRTGAEMIRGKHYNFLRLRGSGLWAIDLKSKDSTSDILEVMHMQISFRIFFYFRKKEVGFMQPTWLQHKCFNHDPQRVRIISTPEQKNSL